MNTFVGYNILVLDHDVIFAGNLSSALRLLGAHSVPVQTIKEAKEHFLKNDYDILLSSSLLSDGFLHELLDWSHENLIFMPMTGTLGFPLSKEAKTLNQYDIAGFFSRDDFPALFSELTKLIFNKDDFKSNLQEMSHERGLIYELNFASVKIVAQPVELALDRIFLNLNENRFPHEPPSLQITSNVKKDKTNFSLTGILQKKLDDEHEFIIHKNSLVLWSKYLENLKVRQTIITNYLKKVSGY